MQSGAAMGRVRVLVAGAVGLAAGVVTIGAAGAQGAGAPFYQDKKITMLIGSSAGGGYDIYARMISRWLGKHIPGNPQIVINNMGGAGSHVASAYLANSAPKDGTYIGAIYMGVVIEPLFVGKRRPTHNPQEFQYIGSANTDYNICAVRSDAPVKSLAETRNTELVVGASAPGGGSFDFPHFTRRLLGLKLKIVTGYPGSREINLALESGEVQGNCGQSWGGVAKLYEPMLKAGTIRIISQDSAVGHPHLNKLGVPLSMSVATTDQQRQAMRLFYSQTVFSRPYVVAKEVPSSQVAILRKAFMDTLRDPELVKEAERLALEVEATSGEALQAKLVELYSAPAAAVDEIRRIFAE